MASTDSSLLARLKDHSHHHPGRPALVRGDTALTYGALAREVEACAALLADGGIGPGCVVGLTVRDDLENVLASVAVLALGATQITLASHDPIAARRSLAERCGVTHLVEDGLGEGIGGSPSIELPRLGEYGQRTIDLGDGRRAAGGGRMYLHTSGTTSRSNIVPVSERDMGLQAERHPEFAGARMLRIPSVEHNNSKRHRLYCLHMGGTAVFLDGTETPIPVQISKYGITRVDVSAMVAAGLAASDDPRMSALMSGTTVAVAGSRVPQPLRESLLARVTPRLEVRYGATEIGSMAVAMPDQHDEESVGHASSGVVLQVVDDGGRELPPGSVGEVRARARGMAEGYLDSPEQTQRRFRDGWFYPGDRGEWRADGTLVVHGRSDEMIILNSINIFPAHLENVLDQHPGVAESAVCGLDSALHGQIPVAAVVLRPGASVQARDLLRFARDHLALRAPRKVVIVEALPRNAEGKVVRREILKHLGSTAR